MKTLQQRPSLFDHLVRSGEERLRNRQPERLGRFEIDHELECCRGLNRQVGGVGAAECFINVGGRAPDTVRNTGSIGHQSARFHDLFLRKKRRQAGRRRKCHGDVD
jgi:hypothetical protein